MNHTVKSIAAALGAQAFGAVDILITSVQEPSNAGPNDLALAMMPKYAEALGNGRATAALVWEGADWQAMGLKAAIISQRPRFAMAPLTRMMDAGQGFASGIHPSAIIDPTAELGKGVSVGAFSIISAGAKIGEGSQIGPQCFIGCDVQLGSSAFLREQVSIGARARIGARFIAQPGVRIGGDGFSFATKERSGVEAVRESLGDQQDTEAQSWERIHSLAAVTIGDDVEVGANSAIDNGTIRNTLIGDGCKLDNMVQIGHNVKMGRDCLMCGHVAIGGSTVIGDNVVLGGMTGVVDNVFVGDRVITGASTKIMSNVPAGRVMLGYPATQMHNQIEIYKFMRRLPRLFRDVASLQKRVPKEEDSD